MPIIKLPLISAIKKLRNKEFMQLYLQMMDVTEKYAGSTQNENLEGVFDRIQKEVECVKQLDVKQNAPSETVKARNEVHQSIKNSFRLIKKLLKADQLSPSDDDRANAKYASQKLDDLLDLKMVTSIDATITVISEIRQTIEDDIKLADALLDLNMMERLEVLYNFGAEFEQLEMQKSIESLTAPVIDKKYIRKEATGTLKLLFDCITVNYWLTKDEVWREMGEEVIQLTIDS